MKNMMTVSIKVKCRENLLVVDVSRILMCNEIVAGKFVNCGWLSLLHIHAKRCKELIKFYIT